MNILEKIAKDLNIRFPIARFSKDLEYSKGVISQYYNGKREISEEFKKKFENFYNIKFSNYENLSQEEVLISSDETIDVLRNNNGNTYYLKDDGSIEIEVINLPFPAYASYLEVFTDERQVLEEFNKTKFAVDKIGKGYYMSFDIKGDSMNGGGIDDTPDGAKVLARELGRHLWQSFRKEKYGYILMTKNNIYHKDIVDYDNEKGILMLHSRNHNCKDFTISINDVYRIFYVIKRTF